jgi:hypothetical protein
MHWAARLEELRARLDTPSHFFLPLKFQKLEQSQQDMERSIMSYPFNESLVIAVQLKLLGVTVKRRLRITYGYTPEWPYVDPETGIEKKEESALNLNLEILARPRAEITPSAQPHIHRMVPIRRRHLSTLS